MKSRRRSYLVESDISVISIISRDTSREIGKWGGEECSVYQRLACHRRWDSWPPQISPSEMRWAPIFGFSEMSSDQFWEKFLTWAPVLREFSEYEWFLSVECEKNEFSFCILILDFISRVGNFEISSIKGCHRMRWKMLKFWGKISIGV